MEIEQYLWGMTPEGEAVLLYVMRAASGAEVRLCNYGAAVVSVTMPDREGNLARVVAGYDRYDDYAGDLSCCGKTLGRWAGRIARGRMALDGSEYRLERNDRASHLHGGSRGFGSFRPLRETLGPEAGADERSFRLDDWRPGILAEAGELRDPRSGRCLTLLTSQPCVTLRTGLHYADPSWNDDTAVALECGALPDAVNQPEFPSSVLHAGELYCQKTVLRFGLS